MRAILLLVCLLLAQFANAKATTLCNTGIMLSHPSSTSALAGSVTTVAFRVLNCEDVTAHLNAHAVLPASWSLIAEEGNVSLAPNDNELMLVSMAIPRSARPGIYVVHYTVGTGIDKPNAARDSLVVEVRQSPALDVQFLAAPAIVRAGTAFSATFLLRNYGNTTLQLDLSASAESGLIANPDFTHAAIAPDNSFAITVRVLSPSHISNEIRARVTLVAVDKSQRLVSKTASGTVRILPGAGAQRDVNNDVLPLRFFTRVNSAQHTTSSFELSGSGALVGGSDVRVEVIARTPMRVSGLLVNRDEYTLRIGNSKWSTRLGDQTMALSRLTETARPGFGASANASAGPLFGAVVALHDRREQRENVYGASLGLRAGTLGSVRMNYMSSTGYQNPRIVSSAALFFPARIVHAEVELARALGTTDGYAHTIDINGSARWLNYSIRTVRSTDAYTLTRVPTANDAAALRIRPAAFLELGGSYSASNQRSLFAGFSGRSIAYRGFANISTFLFVDTENRRWMPQAGLAMQTAIIRARMRIRAGPFTLEPGVAADLSAPDSTKTNLRYIVRAGLNFGRQHLSASIGDNSSSGTAVNWVSNEASADMTPIRGTHILFDYQHDQFSNIWRTTRVTGSIEQTLPQGHQIAARIRSVSFNGLKLNEQSLLTIEYMLPVGIPMARPQFSAVSGIVTSLENGRPVSNVLVRLDGRSVLTTSNGKFAFHNVTRDVHYVQIDLSPNGAGLTVVGPNPALVDASNGSRELQIEVARGGHIRGTLALRPPVVEQEGAAAASFLHSAVIELTQGADIQRRAVDAAGHFSFEGLRPGSWRFRVANDVPLDFALAADTPSKIEVAPGSDIVLDIWVVRRNRPVQLAPEREIPTLRVVKK